MLIYLSICLTLYIIGGSFLQDYVYAYSVICALLTLPTAQHAAKFFSYRRYHGVSKAEFSSIEALSEHFLVLGELPIIKEKKEVETLISVLTDRGIYILISRDADKKKAHQIVKSILQPKGYAKEIHIDTEYEKFKHRLTTEVKSKAQSSDMSELGKLAKELIVRSY